MRRILLSIFTLLFMSLTASYAIELKKPDLPVKSWVLMDYETGAVLAEHEPNSRLEPASLTKLMTSYLIADAIENGVLSYSDTVRISHNAYKQVGSRMFIEQNSQVSIENLLRGLIIQSGNDASVALAEHLSGSESAFVSLMNAKANELGMRNTHFQNTNGLPHPQHYSSAYDLAYLSRSLIQRFPRHYKMYSEKSFTWNNISQNNRNRLLWIESSGVDVIKTGHTDAGYNLASSAERNGWRVIAVVIGAATDADRNNASLNLLNYAFHNFSQREVYQANQKISEIPINNGTKENLSIGPSQTIKATLPHSQYSNLSAKIVVPQALEAPISQNQAVAELHILIDERVVYRYPLFALESVEKSSIFNRLWNEFKFKLGKKYAKFKEAL